MKVYIAADHNGFSLKEILKVHLMQKGIETVDMGAEEKIPTDDYPEYAKRVSEKVAKEEDSKGIVLCGSGVGICIASDKIKGIRCALGFDPRQVKDARNDDDVNVLALASEYLSEEKAKELVDVFLSSPFEPEERFKRRIEQIHQLEV
ncbi:MAG TPA: RpiB/LacA/LacB family sugar-phosphate isomerase [Patescibacteria group bacterium]|nr:RpiB/LacA/LacB family sugar-phosphate isomerase [Patescibacteria group bacterium]